MLQRSLSTSSLLKQATAAVQAQKNQDMRSPVALVWDRPFPTTYRKLSHFPLSSGKYCRRSADMPSSASSSSASSTAAMPRLARQNISSCTMLPLNCARNVSSSSGRRRECSLVIFSRVVSHTVHTASASGAALGVHVACTAWEFRLITVSQLRTALTFVSPNLIATSCFGYRIANVNRSEVGCHSTLWLRVISHLAIARKTAQILVDPSRRNLHG